MLSLGGGVVCKEKKMRIRATFLRPSEIYFFPRERKRSVQVFVGHNMLQFTFSARVRPTRHGAPCFWVASRGHVYDRTPLSAVCGCRWAEAPLWHALWTDHTGATRQKKKQTLKKKATSKHTSVHVCRSCAIKTGHYALFLGREQRESL